MINETMWIEAVERELEKMKRGDAAQKRASMYAIQTLCEAGLQQTSPSSFSSSAVQQPVAPSVQQVSEPTSLDGEVLQEEDANGPSLFDF